MRSPRNFFLRKYGQRCILIGLVLSSALFCRESAETAQSEFFLTGCSPGVGRLPWEQEAARSNRATRTTSEESGSAPFPPLPSSFPNRESHGGLPILVYGENPIPKTAGIPPIVYRGVCLLFFCRVSPVRRGTALRFIP